MPQARAVPFLNWEAVLHTSWPADGSGSLGLQEIALFRLENYYQESYNNTELRLLNGLPNLLS